MEENTSSESWELIKNTVCNTACLAILTENRVLSDEDVDELDSIPNRIEKSRKLFKFLLTKKGWYSHLITALQEGRQSGALNVLNKFGGEDEVAKCFGSSVATPPPRKRAKQKSPIRFDMIAPVLNFTGRESQLCDIHRKLQHNIEKRTVISQLASVVGLGGIGKTELAQKYAQEYGEFYDGNVIWISAQSEETLSKSFRRLATNHLNISLTNVDNKEVDINAIVAQIYRYFENQKVLFVFDNAESTEYLQRFIAFGVSPSVSRPYILLTSRDRDWSFSTEVLELNEMTEKDAICFVKTSLQIEYVVDDDEVLKLVDRLQRYPLALSQAVSFIKQRRKIVRNFSISQYLEKLKKNSKKLLDCKRSPVEFNTYRETTLTTWRVTTQQISTDEENGRCSMKILNSMAYFLPEKIPVKLFANLSDGDEYHEALLLLVKYSMINVHHEEDTVSVHRLVQEVTRIQLKMNNQEEQAINLAFQLISSCQLDDMEKKVLLTYHAIIACGFRLFVGPELSMRSIIPLKIVSVCLKECKEEEYKSVISELGRPLASIFSKKDCEHAETSLLLTATPPEMQYHEACLRLLEMLRMSVMIIKAKPFYYVMKQAVDRLSANYFRRVGSHIKAVKVSNNCFVGILRLFELKHCVIVEFLINYVNFVYNFSASADSSVRSEMELKLHHEKRNAALSYFVQFK